jgi:PAS domain-containing protein
MNMLQSLTLRTNAALGRLADLQRRAERAAQGPAGLMKPALRELSSALEELQVANEQLQAQVDELSSTRHAMQAGQRLFEELQDVMPIACVWTDRAATIQHANPRAAALLNVARDRLAGKPLILFVTDRQALFDSLAQLQNDHSDSIELTATVRPRERHPRRAKILVRRLEHDTRLCWFVRPIGEEPMEDGNGHGGSAQSQSTEGSDTRASAASSGPSDSTA